MEPPGIAPGSERPITRPFIPIVRPKPDPANIGAEGYEGKNTVIDHLAFGVRDYAAAKAFYIAALKPLGMRLLTEVAQNSEGQPACGFGREEPIFWIAGDHPATGLHFAFTVEERATVDAFHAAALAAGGRDNGAPGLRPQYDPDYYAAFVWYLDGNNIEAVCHTPG